MKPLMVAWLLSSAAPTTADLQAFEERRILAPLTDYTVDGRAFVEFAPSVETQNVTCVLVSKRIYDCRYDSRIKPSLANDFEPWQTRNERIMKRRKAWIRADKEG
jgi:hypothetical protein